MHEKPKYKREDKHQVAAFECLAKFGKVFVGPHIRIRKLANVELKLFFSQNFHGANNFFHITLQHHTYTVDIPWECAQAEKKCYLSSAIHKWGFLLKKAAHMRPINYCEIAEC